MTNGFIRTSVEDLEMLNVLRKIYEMESSKISGPRSYGTDVRQVVWTKEDLERALGEPLDPAQEAFLEELVDARQLLRIDGSADDDQYISRVAETVRVLGHSYEYWQGGRPSAEAVRWLIEDKRVPARTIPAAEVIERIASDMEAEPSHERSFNVREAVNLAVRAVGQSFEQDWEDARFSEFQLSAVKAMVRSQFVDSDRVTPRHQVLTADVGAGKTAAFTLGMMVSAVENRLSGGAKRTHLFLYPRTALAKDQYKTIREMVENLEAARPRIHFEHYSYYQEMGMGVKRGLREVYGDPESSPDLIITTLETLKRRLHNPDFVRSVVPQLERVVLDEIHLVEGTTGTNVIRLMDRLRSLADDDILWTGSSATVATPDEHTAEVFGLDPRDVKHIAPREADLQRAGLVHHVFVKPKEDVSTLGLLTNVTSILLHSRRGRIGNRETGTGRPKALGFADNLDLLGRWNAEVRENERTEWQSKGRGHPRSGEDPQGWSSREREIPYALRYHNPLTRRMQAVGGSADSEPYAAVLEEAEVRDPCSLCRDGRSVHVGTVQPSELQELGRFVYREPHKAEDNVLRFQIDHEAFAANEPVEIGTLDRCPFLQAGACLWFPEDDFEAEKIPGSRSNYEWKHVARSSIHSSKKQNDAEALSDELEDIVFKASTQDVYDELHDGEMIDVDIVLASPSLEVGIDLENITEEVMHKAIRNIASYRQKAGRAGREVGSDTMVVTVLSQRAVDLHYYRQPRKLVSSGRLDPVPLKEYNKTLLKAGLYMATWDYLAMKHRLPEAIPTELMEEAGQSKFATMLRSVRSQIDADRPGLLRHLDRFSRGSANEATKRAAIEQVSTEVDILLSDASSIYENETIVSAADLVVNHISRRSVEPRIRGEIRSILQELHRLGGKLREIQANLKPTGLGIGDEIIQVNQMRSAGWQPEILNRVLSSMPEAPSDFNLNLYVLHLEQIRSILHTLREAHAIDDVRPYYLQQQLTEVFPGGGARAHYLSYVIQDLPLFKFSKVDPGYAMLPTLFKNPYEPQVQVTMNRRTTPGRNGPRTRHDEVALNEMLFSMMPGTWTYRLGKEPFKTRIGQLATKDGGVAFGSLAAMVDEGHQFKVVKNNVAGPPWDEGPFDVYRPVLLQLQETDKFIDVDLSRNLTEDELGSSIPSSLRQRVKVPKNFLERWVSISSERSIPITVHQDGVERMVVESPEGDGESRARPKDIRHPMFDGMLENVSWHPKLDVVEYVHGANRYYTSGSLDGLQIRYKDGPTGVAFGRSLTTEGVSFELAADLVDSVRDEIVHAMLDDARWAPTSMTAIEALIGTQAAGTGIELDSFTLQDLVGTLGLSMEDDLEDVTFRGLKQWLQELIANPQRLDQEAEVYARAKFDKLKDDLESEVGDTTTASDDEPIDRVRARLKAAARALRGNLDDLEDRLDGWVELTLLNTFGIVLIQALQRLSGTPEEKIGYLPDIEALREGTYRVFVYDREERGNGTTELLRDYLHILFLQRVVDERAGHPMLPSEDFLTILEQELLQCPQHHTDVNALAMFAQERNGTEASGLPTLSYVREHSKEVLSVGRTVWEQIGVEGPQSGWKLPLLNRAKESIATRHGLHQDDVSRATGICWTGCPECVLSDSVIMGSVAGRKYVDKKVLDRWFSRGRGISKGYREVTIEDLVQGTAAAGIGSKTRLRWDTPQGTIRSMGLPFTIGVDVDLQGDVGRKLIFRTGDTVGMDLFPDHDRSEVKGISVGMGRLIGYLLLTSAYLGALDALPEDRKKIKMVFYDARDIHLDEQTFSQTMLEALDVLHGAGPPYGPIERLSDIVGWMAANGFEVTLCVDSGRAKEQMVAQFMKDVRTKSGGNATVITRRINLGSMHAKMLHTPVGAVDGSANLTFSGTQLNDEVVNYSEVGSPGYQNLEVSIDDIIRSAG